MNKNEFLSIYIHTPFCESRCSYCDFNTYVGFESKIDDYVKSVIKEIQIVSKCINNNGHCVQTVYFGGGTPTLIKPSQLTNIIECLSGQFNVNKNVEITIEANPCMLDDDYFSKLESTGINRLSIGMQSANEGELKLLGRRHTYQDVESVVCQARDHGFSNINLDLIFGFPLQTMKTFKDSLESAIKLFPDHFSLYAMTLEENRPLARMIREKIIPEIDDDLAAEMYEWAMDFLLTLGYHQYEISNWARGKDKECRHNIQYWRNLEYLGFGSGAHSHYNNQRWENILTIPEYIQSIDTHEIKNVNLPSPAILNYFELTLEIQKAETIMMGLRLTEEGLNLQSFKNRFDVDFEDIYRLEIDDLIQKKLIQKSIYQNQRSIRLTRKGRLLGNQVFEKFLL